MQPTRVDITSPSYGPATITIDYVDPPNDFIDVLQWHIVNRFDLPNGLLPGVPYTITLVDLNIDSDHDYDPSIITFGPNLPIRSRRTVTIRGTFY